MIKCLEGLDTSCDTCNKYKKAKPRPCVGLPMAKSFNETVAMDLKQFSSSPPIWFLHLIDHATRYSASSVIRSKRKEVIVKNVFKLWITTFGTADKFLMDNGGEFCNSDFVTFCENYNIRICTTAAESPWSNGLVERHNAILGLTVSKVIEDTSCDLEVALAWAISAKNSLKNVHGFSPNQLVFGRNPNYPNVCDNSLPALEGRTTSEMVADNLNAMHSARHQYIKSESSDKLRRALRHQKRTYSDIKYTTGDLVYYKREGANQWRGPGTVIGQDGQQVLVRHSSSLVRVHPCRLQLIQECTKAVESQSLQIVDSDENIEKVVAENEVNEDLVIESDCEVDDEVGGVIGDSVSGVGSGGAGGGFGAVCDNDGGNIDVSDDDIDGDESEVDGDEKSVENGRLIIDVDGDVENDGIHTECGVDDNLDDDVRNDGVHTENDVDDNLDGDVGDRSFDVVRESDEDSSIDEISRSFSNLNLSEVIENDCLNSSVKPKVRQFAEYKLQGSED